MGNKRQSFQGVHCQQDLGWECVSLRNSGGIQETLGDAHSLLWDGPRARKQSPALYREGVAS